MMRILSLIIFLFQNHLYASESTTKPMEFSQCKKAIIKSQSPFGSKHKVIMNTEAMYMAKTFTSDADILFTCVKKNNELIITKTIK